MFLIVKKELHWALAHLSLPLFKPTGILLQATNEHVIGLIIQRLFYQKTVSFAAPRTFCGHEVHQKIHKFAFKCTKIIILSK